MAAGRTAAAQPWPRKPYAAHEISLLQEHPRADVVAVIVERLRRRLMVPPVGVEV
jgi:hypothetical protein